MILNWREITIQMEDSINGVIKDEYNDDVNNGNWIHFGIIMKPDTRHF